VWLAIGARSAAAPIGVPPVVRYGGQGNTPEVRRLLAAEIDRAVAQAPERLGGAVPTAIEVVICATQSEFRAAAGAGAGPFLLGVAQPDAGRIVLNGESLSGVPASVVGTLRHELAHLTVHAAADRGGTYLPRWFDEGVASWFGNRYTELGPMQVEQLVNASWLALDALDVTFPEDVYRRRLAYEKSVRAIEEIERARAGAVAGIVGGLETGVPVLAALEADLGWTVDMLDERTRRTTRRSFFRHGLWSVATNVYALLALVVIIGFVLRRRRYRRRLSEWGEGDGV